MNDNDLLTPEDIALLLAVRPATVRGWLRAGLLPALKLNGKAWRVRQSDLDRFLRDQQSEATR